VGPRQLIVVGADGSAASIDALHWAMRQAHATAAEVIVVAAWEVPTTLGFDVADDAVDWAAHARQAVEDAVTEASRCEPSVTVTPRVVRGHAGTILVEESGDADLLVVGSRGHRTAVGMLLGSVSEYCVHHAACPVVVVRLHRHQVVS
jgi:nucleotide-binding universal stress UspA family protein